MLFWLRRLPGSPPSPGEEDPNVVQTWVGGSVPKSTVSRGEEGFRSRQNRKWKGINPEKFRDVVLRCQKSCCDYCDKINQFLDNMMKKYDLTILWKHSRQSSMILRNGQLMRGYLFIKKEECQGSNFSKHILSLGTIQGTFGKMMSLIA